jgi:hypothetical protein
MEYVGNGEDDVVVLGGQQRALLALDPAHLVESLALGAMSVATGVMGDLAVATAVTLVEVTAEGRCAAARDRRDGTCLVVAQGGQMEAVLAEEVGKLPSRSSPAPSRVGGARHRSALR